VCEFPNIPENTISPTMLIVGLKEVLMVGLPNVGGVIEV
jgi:hypothetical protein